MVQWSLCSARAPPNGSGFASGINEAGDIVGLLDGAPFVLLHTGRFQLLDIPSPYYDNHEVTDINDKGQIVGAIGVTNERRVAVWDTSGVLRHTYPSEPTSYDELTAASINNEGVVVGTRTDFGWSAFVWEIGEEIQYLLNNSTGAFDVNASGVVIGITQGSPTYDFFGVTWRSQPPLHITTPNTPSSWGINTRQRLSWTYFGSATHFAIDFSPEPDTWIEIDIVDNEPGNSQNYYRTVTAPPTAAGRLRVRALGDPAAVDVNDADITIAPATVGIIYPRPSSTRAFGSTERIFYTHNLGARAPVAIDVSGDNGRTWRTAAARAETNGSTTASFYWIVDLTPTTQARVRVRALDGSGASAVSSAFAVDASIPRITTTTAPLRNFASLGCNGATGATASFGEVVYEQQGRNVTATITFRDGPPSTTFPLVYFAVGWPLRVRRLLVCRDFH